MSAGAISADGVSRRFRVHARETRTLKDLVTSRGRTGGEDSRRVRRHIVAVVRGRERADP